MEYEVYDFLLSLRNGIFIVYFFHIVLIHYEWKRVPIAQEKPFNPEEREEVE